MQNVTLPWKNSSAVDRTLDAIDWNNKSEAYELCAEAFCAEHQCVIHNGLMYIYDKNHYRLVEDEGCFIGNWFIRHGIQYNSNIRTNVVQHIRDYKFTQVKRIAPYFITGDMDAKKFIPFANGLLNIDSYCAGNPIVIDHTSNLFSAYCLPFDFQPDAKCPQWLKFLEEVYEDQKQIDLLQQWFGYCLTSDTSRQKFMNLCGVSRSGKGTICDVLRAMVGDENSIGFKLSRFMDRFSVSTLEHKAVATIGEAILSAKDKPAILEAFASITGNDPVTIEHKGKDVMRSAALPTRFTICCNDQLSFHDNAGALPNRMLVLNHVKSFAGIEDNELAEKLKTELDAIAVWALQGLKRLNSEGWSISEASLETIKHIEREASVPLAFLQDVCEVWEGWHKGQLPGVAIAEGLKHEIWCTRQEFSDAYKLWAEDQGIEPKFKFFAKDLRTRLPALGREDRRTIDKKKVKGYFGVHLKEEAMRELKEDASARGWA